MGRERPPQLVPPLVEPHRVPTSPRDRDEVARWPGEPQPRPAKSAGAAVVRAVLGPPDRPAEPSGPEIVGAQDLLDERAQWAFPRRKHVVHGKDGAGGEVGTKQGQVLFHRGVVVVAVDPEESDGLAPGTGELARQHATRVDRRRDTGSPYVREEVVVGRALAAQVGIRVGRGSVGIHSNDFAQPVSLGDIRESNGGASLEAPDLDYGALRWRASGGEYQESRLAFRQIAGRLAHVAPRLIGRRLEVGREVGHRSPHTW